MMVLRFEQRDHAVMGMSQKAIADLLEGAWTFVQEVHERTGVVIELRLTALGLTAHTADAICSRARTITWQELGASTDLLRLVADAIDHACGRRVTVVHPILEKRERMAA